MAEASAGPRREGLMPPNTDTERYRSHVMRLGNSSCSPTIAGLVLEHLCPSIQNILEDGLRDHKLDLIIGQRRNHPWSVVEVSTRTGKCHQTLPTCLSDGTGSLFVPLQVPPQKSSTGWCVKSGCVRSSPRTA
uniref:RUN domain-containing protein n=1 Tax=Takifugu rubripes TaxID=31033 RepID=A0A674M9H0_TAKRU